MLLGQLEIANEFDGGSILGYQTRGHVDKKEFIDALEYDYGMTCEEVHVFHRYARNVPYAGTKQMFVQFCKGQARGVYLITEVDITNCREI